MLSIFLGVRTCFVHLHCFIFYGVSRDICIILLVLFPSFSSSANIYNRFSLQLSRFKLLIRSFFVSNICTILPVSIDQTSTTANEPATNKVGVSRAAKVKGLRHANRFRSRPIDPPIVKIPTSVQDL